MSEPSLPTPPPLPDAVMPRLGLPPSAIPKHVAIIMDGNGRWAVRQGRHRTFGHETGARVVPRIVTECSNLGLKALTLYSFSMENWKRPEEEIAFLMELCAEYLKLQLDEMMANNVRFRQIGRREGLPDVVQRCLDHTEQQTRHNTGLTLALALNYGSRMEITDAVRQIARQVAEGSLRPQEITERTISDRLYTAGLPDPDLLIRTAGEMRLSNFLLWQISYAELWVTDTLWPEFDVEELHEAIRVYATRQRRFGAVEPAKP